MVGLVYMERPEFKKIKEGVWEISKSFKPGMRVPVRVTATKKLLDQMENGVFEQITNVAFLPGIQRFALCMPDGHWGYGFPIGGVAAFDVDEGIISPGGIGFDDAATILFICCCSFVFKKFIYKN